VRILIVCHYFPPLNSIASHRPFSWARTWTDLGHDVTVLTPAKYGFDGSVDLEFDTSGVRIVQAPYLPLAPAGNAGPGGAVAARTRRWERLKLATRRIRLGLGMFAEIANLAHPSLVREGRKLFEEKPFDLVVSTSPPEVCHVVAHGLAKRFAARWVADYRDLWFPEMGVYRYAWAARLIGRIERRMLRDAAAVVTVSEGLAERLRAFLGRTPIVCYNGFMELQSDLRAARPWPDTRHHVVYTGKLFPGQRDPSAFLTGLANALERDASLAERLAVDFYGHDDPWLRGLIDERGLARVVTTHGFVPYTQSLAAQRHAAALLFVDWMDPRAEGILTGKLFEYLASGRPILCLGNRADTEAARVVREAQAGTVAITAGEVAQYLAGLGSGAAPAGADAARVAIFSRRVQAERLLERIGGAESPARSQHPHARA
jgi:glycosyltransferase involved in cell wall biosynthesis